MKRTLLFRWALGLVALVTIISCEDDDVEVFVPDELVIDGPAEVGPTETASYSANLYEGNDYTWSVPAGATIVEGDGTASIDVTFAAGASGEITVNSRGVSGTKTVTVVAAAPEVSVAIDSSVVALSQGGTGTVSISFDRDIATPPDVMLLTSDSTTGIIGPLERVDENTFQATYTAGTGDGAEQLSIGGAVATEELGSAAMDTVIAFDLYSVDNTAATGELLASRTPVGDSTSATVSAIFSEPLSTSDSVKVSVASADTVYVEEATMTTEDGMTWTYDFQPEGARNELVEISVSNLPPDLAGNPTEAIEEPILLEVRND